MRLLNRPAEPAGPTTWAGLLIGVALGLACITLVWLGMRSVMAIGGACAEGGPYVPAQPCPDGAPAALMLGMFGMFGSAGIIIWSGARLGLAGLPMLGWPILFLSLGWNFLEFGVRPPDGGGLVWGWIVCAIAFLAMGGLPVLAALPGIPRGTIGRLLRPLTAAIVGAGLAGIWLGATLWGVLAA